MKLSYDASIAVKKLNEFMRDEGKIKKDKTVSFPNEVTDRLDDLPKKMLVLIILHYALVLKTSIGEMDFRGKTVEEVLEILRLKKDSEYL